VAIAPCIAEAVQFAGGWLFDQVMAGWDVSVLTGDHTDPRPLRILGARAADLESALASSFRGPCLQAIAVRADLYESDARVRGLVLEALGEGLPELRLWGDRWPEELDGSAGPVSHRLSVAARAFKAQALAAADAPADADEITEVFHRGEAKRPSPIPAR
jgi:hypothetical protein